MADFSALKTSIQNYIKQNGNEEITGNLLQQILLSMVSTLGDSAINDLVAALNTEIANRGNADTTLQGNINSEATTRANADTELGGRITTLQGVVNGIKANVENGYVYAGIATPSTTPASGKVFYLALTAGTYNNFGATVVPQGINILKYNGTAWSLDSFLGLDDAPTQGSNNLVNSGGVLDSIIKDGSAFDLSAYNSGATYADLSAALTALNALPAAYKKGGMSFKYVQTSDNKYVQFINQSNSFTTDTECWKEVTKQVTYIKFTKNGYYNTAGVFIQASSADNWMSTELINIMPINSLCIHLLFGANGVSFYDKNKNYISGITVGEQTVINSLDIPSNAAYYAFSAPFGRKPCDYVEIDNIETLEKIKDNILSLENQIDGLENQIDGFNNISFSNDGYYYNTAGQLQPLANFAATILLPVSNKYAVHLRKAFGANTVSYYNAEKGYISGVTAESAGDTSIVETLTIPSNAKYISFCYNKTVKGNYVKYGVEQSDGDVKIELYNLQNKKEKVYTSNINDAERAKFSKLNTSVLTAEETINNKCYSTNGSQGAASGYNGAWFEVTAGDVFSVKGTFFFQADLYKPFYANDDLSNVALIDGIHSSEDGNTTFTVPNGFTRVYFNYLASAAFVVTLYTEVFNELVLNRWNGKIISCLGDSLTWGQISGTQGNGKSWTEFLKEYTQASLVKNCGIPGSNFIGNSEGTYGYMPFCGRIDADINNWDYPSGQNPTQFGDKVLADNSDLIIVWGGVNDFYLEKPLGTFGDVNSTTFYGAVKMTIEELIDRFNSARIAFITPMKCNTSMHFSNNDARPLMESFTANAQGLILKDYVDAIKKVCDYYSIPVLDMYSYAPFNPNNSIWKAEYMVDGLHTTVQGYELIAQQILEFINNL